MFNFLRLIRHHVIRPFQRKYHYGIVYLNTGKYAYIDHDARLELAIVKILEEYFAEMKIIFEYEEYLDILKDTYNKANRADADCAKREKYAYDAFSSLFKAYTWFTKDRPALAKMRSEMEKQMGSLISFNKTTSGMFVLNSKNVSPKMQDDYNDICKQINQSDDKHFMNVVKYRGFMWV